MYTYFDREAETDHSARVLRLDGHFKSHLTKLLVLFLDYALDSLSKFNATFQSSLPMLPLVQNEVKWLPKLFIAKFMKTETVRSVNDFTTLNFNDSQAHLSDQHMSIGHKRGHFWMQNIISLMLLSSKNSLME